MRAKHALIAWSPPSGGRPGKVEIRDNRRDEENRWARKYCIHTGAAWDLRNSNKGWETLATILMDFALIAKSGVDAETAYREFEKIDEFRYFMSDRDPDEMPLWFQRELGWR